jgi:hypothetical protein
MWIPWAMVASVVLLACGREAHAEIVLPRPGQVGVEIQGGYGSLLNTGNLGHDFGSGGTLAIRLRYRMRYERSLSLSFENQRPDIRVAELYDPNYPGQLLPGRDHANLVLSGIEFGQLFGTRTRATKMLMVGAGLAQSSIRTIDNDTIFPGDGVFLSLGAGVEYFVFRSWALDLSTRYNAMFLSGDTEHDVQAAVGFIFYASY